jgi:hypothetical protein|tara:strand:+ start:361 stop:744 length:384 start_codon:yes stop_codon:yes gene_type:complete
MGKTRADKYKTKYKTAKNEIQSLKLQIEKLKVKPTVSSFTKRNKLNALHKMLAMFNPLEDDIYRCDQLFFKAVNCPEMMGKRASSITSVVIYLGMSGVTKCEIYDKCQTTPTTLNKLLNICRKNNIL